MVQTPKSGLSRAALLEAAGNLVAQRGALLLTLDAVAKDAGISKGGLLHHFPTKESLLVALAERETQDYHTQLAKMRAAAGKLGITLDRLSSHLLMGYFQSLGSKTCNVRADILAGMLPAVSSTPELGQSISAFFQSLFGDIRREVAERCEQEGLSADISHARFAEAATRCVAAEGAFMLALYGVSVLSPEEEGRVLSGLIRGLSIRPEQIQQLLQQLEAGQ